MKLLFLFFVASMAQCTVLWGSYNNPTMGVIDAGSSQNFLYSLNISGWAGCPGFTCVELTKPVQNAVWETVVSGVTTATPITTATSSVTEYPATGPSSVLSVQLSGNAPPSFYGFRVNGGKQIPAEEYGFCRLTAPTATRMRKPKTAPTPVLIKTETGAGVPGGGLIEWDKMFNQTFGYSSFTQFYPQGQAPSLSFCIKSFAGKAFSASMHQWAGDGSNATKVTSSINVPGDTGLVVPFTPALKTPGFVIAHASFDDLVSADGESFAAFVVQGESKFIESHCV